MPLPFRTAGVHGCSGKLSDAPHCLARQSNCAWHQRTRAKRLHGLHRLPAPSGVPEGAEGSSAALRRLGIPLLLPSGFAVLCNCPARSIRKLGVLLRRQQSSGLGTFLVLFWKGRSFSFSFNCTYFFHFFMVNCCMLFTAFSTILLSLNAIVSHLECFGT